MVPCYFSKTYVRACYAALVMSPLMIILLYCLGWVAFLVPEDEPLAGRCILLCLCHSAAAFITLLMLLQVVDLRSYVINECGITIGYGFGKKIKRFYPWNAVTSICLCSLQLGTPPSSYKNVIWCTFGEKFHDPRKLKTSWSFGRVLDTHFRQILTIEYTPERLEGFRLFYDKEIPDYRKESPPPCVF